MNIHPPIQAEPYGPTNSNIPVDPHSGMTPTTPFVVQPPDPFAEVNRKFEAQRKRLEASLQELKANRPSTAQPPQNVAPVAPPVASATPVVKATPEQNPMTGINKVMMEQGVAMMLAKIAQALTVEEQEWVSGNLISLPGFMSSNSGKAVIQLVFREYRDWMEK